ncbi:11780_t:CDS:2 [Paraglomus brasilianum]|uniref:11780_t:CDS:1 n=1 Tax=Paraglomus brasilianum TaxID=144538 RepID=A0A9N8ZEG6_9GLOM|nr:11780_t:CDS:2 [Paraglomus brasilianum]
MDPNPHPRQIDPQVLAMLTVKRDDVCIQSLISHAIATALRTAATAVDEFQALIPRDVSILPPTLTPVSPTTTTLTPRTHRKGRKSYNKDPNAPKKPNTAYIIFSNEIRAEMKANNPEANQKELVKLIGSRWKALSTEQKKVYEDRYFADKERYDEELRAYRGAHGSPSSSSSAEDTDMPPIVTTPVATQMPPVGNQPFVQTIRLPITTPQAPYHGEPPAQASMMSTFSANVPVNLPADNRIGTAEAAAMNIVEVSNVSTQTSVGTSGGNVHGNGNGGNQGRKRSSATLTPPPTEGSTDISPKTSHPPHPQSQQPPQQAQPTQPAPTVFHNNDQEDESTEQGPPKKKRVTKGVKKNAVMGGKKTAETSSESLNSSVVKEEDGSVRRGRPKRSGASGNANGNDGNKDKDKQEQAGVTGPGGRRPNVRTARNRSS